MTAREGLSATVHSLASFEERLDLAQELGLTQIELTQGGDPSGAAYLLRDAEGLKQFMRSIESRDLRISALNCSGMPLHPRYGDQHRTVIRQTILLAEELGVEKIVGMSGVGGDGAGSSTINWIFFPWPTSSVELAARQWDEVTSLWSELSAEAEARGIKRIALELHPLHVVYNLPTLFRLRDRVGPIIGATLDPSHLFWQYMDPSAMVDELGEALFHVHLKDTALDAQELAVAGVLDDRPFDGPRAWVQRTIGRGHDSTWWSGFLGALHRARYTGALSIENEDPDQSYEEGVREAAAFLHPLLGRLEAAA
jgi:sugar phosphate isomerase/epimerase